MSRSPHITRKQLEALSEKLEGLYLQGLVVRISESQVEGALEVIADDRAGRDYLRIMRDGLVVRPQPFDPAPPNAR